MDRHVDGREVTRATMVKLGHREFTPGANPPAWETMSLTTPSSSLLLVSVSDEGVEMMRCRILCGDVVMTGS